MKEMKTHIVIMDLIKIITASNASHSNQVVLRIFSKNRMPVHKVLLGGNENLRFALHLGRGICNQNVYYTSEIRSSDTKSLDDLVTYIQNYNSAYPNKKIPVELQYCDDELA